MESSKASMQAGSACISRKILSAADLAKTLGALRAVSLSGSPRTVVQCHGCFDIVHPGHIRYLQFARAQGDILVVSITGDAAMDKGELRPYIPEELRAGTLAALELVDYVVIDDHPTAAEVLSLLRPDVYVKGQEYATSADPRFLAERDIVESYGGRVIYSSGEVVFSSTSLGERFGESPQMRDGALAAVCRRHEIHTAGLTQILKRFSSSRVLVLGESIIERYVLCDADSHWTALLGAGEAPMMSLRQLRSEDYLGGAAFTALQAVALGADAVLVTALGDDGHSSFCRDMLNSFGVSIVPIERRGAPPAVHTRFLVDDHKLLKVSEGPSSPLDSANERAALSILHDLCGHADVILLATSAVGHSRDGLISPALLQGFCSDIRPRVSFLATDSSAGSADIAGSMDGPRLRPHLVCTSERRLRAAASDSSAGLSSIAHQFLRRSQADRMLVTLGKRGVVTFERPTENRASAAWNGRLRSEYLPSLATHVADPLGVHSSVLITASLARACGASMMQAAYLAEAVAAVGLAKAGPIAVTADETIEILEQLAPVEPLTDERRSRAETSKSQKVKKSKLENLPTASAF